MPNCLICNHPVTSAYVVCSHCVGMLRPFTLPTELAYFINQLSEEIVMNEKIPSCGMCAIGACGGQVSSLTCRNAVKAWLLSQAELYFSKMRPKEKKIA